LTQVAGLAKAVLGSRISFMVTWDVFISYASQDKTDVARPLADILAARGVRAWLDEAEMTLGDSLRVKIDAGLNQSQFGVVILSPSFFSKEWPKSELDRLLARETDGVKVILPVWHRVTLADIRKYSAILAGRLGVSTDKGLHYVARTILTAIKAAGRARVTPRPIFEGRLSKKILLSLPEGSVLMSNGVNTDLTPQIVEELATDGLREELWNHLRSAGLTGTKFYVFENMAHLRLHLESRHNWLVDDLASK
jgi:hypothetical protein